jgi:FtsZ-binding cell division protein ZapB
MTHLAQLKENIFLKDYELGSLSSVLQDPLSQTLIQQSSEIALKLKDEKYHSGKEGERWTEELGLQKKILSDHLDQLYKVEELNASLIREKITGLQQASLDGINRQISVLQEQISDTLKSSRQSLAQEKELLKKKIDELRSRASKLPHKWVQEQWLEQKSNLAGKMIEAITNVVETKTIGHHLHHVESKPLDLATPPLEPVSPKLFSFSCAGAFLFAFGSFFASLIRSILKGFPTSGEKLRAMNFPFLGGISSHCDGPPLEPVAGSDLDLLRKAALFIESPPKSQTIGLVLGNGPDYSYALAENLARTSKKSLLLRCDFKAKFRREDLPGILQVWNGETTALPLRKKEGYDLMTAGGFTPYGAEILQSGSFHKMIDLLKPHYDWLFLVLRGPIDSSEHLSALKLCDRALVTTSGEQTELLTPFVDWAYHEPRSRLTFIASEFQ